MTAASHKDGDIDVTVGSYTLNKVKGSAFTSCSNVSCHNNAAFTAPAVVWGSNAQCNACHGFPPSASHNVTTDTACNSCHNNVKPGVVVTSTNAIFVDNMLHMNQIVEGSCTSCHGYPPVRSMVGRGTNASYSSARLQNYSGGGGVHDIAAHLLPTVKESNVSGGMFGPCVTCHPSNQHNQANATFGGFSTTFVQVVVDAKFKFDKNRPIVYNGKRSGTSKTSGTCSNVECHMQKSPVWSSEPYTQRH
jgi:predicted CxxxxCH...CXXCH cytochrome family protein